MSLAIHTIVKDGIVICADTRETIHDDKGNVRYDDTLLTDNASSETN